jgi:5-methylcytosine-specific restriction endonuclease McrA
MDEIVQLFNAEVNKLNNDGVKEKAKELGISGLSKLKKPEIVQLLEAEFLKLLPALKEKRATDLKNICKCYGIKGVTGVKKDVIIYNMLLYCCATLTFTLNNAPETEPDVCIKAEPMDLVEQLEKQKLDIEAKLKDELRVREEKRIEIEKKAKEEELRMQEEKRMEELRVANEEAAKLKEDIKKKKQSIPKNVRVIVWNHYISEDIIKHKCLCCKKVTISNTNFEVGHVISEKNNGTHEINNLRPICFACNHSMGTENMIDFVVKYGLYIG